MTRTIATITLLATMALVAVPTVIAQSESTAGADNQLIELPSAIGSGEGKEVSVLVDDSHLKLAVVTLRRGTSLPVHSTPVPATIHVLAGQGVVHVDGKALAVAAGTIVSLAAGADHDVVPAADSDMQLLVHYLRNAGTPATPRHDH